MAVSEFPQHERLTRVLNIYRSAMRRHIAEQWRTKHLESWFEELRTCLTEHQQQEIRNTREALERRRAAGDITISKDDEDEFLIDIPMFLDAVKSRTDLFGTRLTDWEITSKIANVYKARNTWAHPPLRDLKAVEVAGIANDCANILYIFNPAAAEAVLGVTTSDTQASDLGLLLERLDQLLDAIEARSLPSDQLQGILGQILESSSRPLQEVERAKEGDDIIAEVRALRAAIEVLQPTPSPRRRRSRPNVPAGKKIDEYSERQLVQVIKWIESDDLRRTEDDLLNEAIRELGFKRRGSKIVTSLQSAIRAAR